MALASGTRIGPYEVAAQIGVGGMGEVYRATDTKLKRQVAIKVLPTSVAQDAERLARFQREAEVLASLNHPNIAAIYGLEDTGDAKALVMELVEGPTLADRIAQGAIAVDEALPIAKQIAEALEAAHEQGIIHRDLKPANIKVRPDGTVKVLDFGLAKAMELPAAMLPSVSQAPTITTPAMMTGVGMILGTAAYMSPEQARGKSVDRRTDVWAFGAVLFEMLTGTRAFDGEDVGQTLARVVEREPNLGALPSAVPARVGQAIRVCLRKDSKQRVSDIRDVRLALEGAFETGAPQTASATAWVSRARLAWMVTAAAILGMVSLAVPAVKHLSERPPLALAETRVEIVTPAETDPFSFALSPDGQQLIYVAASGGPARLWLRSLDSTEAQPLASTEGAVYPFWSPDSRSVGFFAGGQLLRLDLASGAPRKLTAVASPRGGTWNADGVILFGTTTRPLSRIAATGGNVSAVTTLDRQQSHRFPTFLPDGQHFLYFAQGPPETGGIWLGALGEKTPTRLTAADAAGLYLPSEASQELGRLLWLRGGTLVAQRLDLTRLALIGDPIPVADGVATEGTVFHGAISVSSTGLVAYRSAGSSQRQLTWYDRSGRDLGKLGTPDENDLRTPQVAPDGRRLAVSRTVQGNTDVWLVDGDRPRRLTFDPAQDDQPTWSPDGNRIAFRSNRRGFRNLYVRDIGGTGGETSLLDSAQSTMTPNDWSADGRHLLYMTQDPQTDWDIWVRPMVGDPKPRAFLKTPFRERYARFSPDGHWVAYASDESGSIEVYVRPFVLPESSATAGESATPAVINGQWQVSTAGGTFPAWRADGRELYFIGPDGAMMSASVTVRGLVFEPGTPMALFPTRILGGGEDNGQNRQYSVSRDGRFLINTLLEDSRASPITLIQNWRPPGDNAVGP